jgi:hypothetical protein
MSGVCKVCGCTDNNACITLLGPCWWVDETQTLCSACINGQLFKNGEGEENMISYPMEEEKLFIPNKKNEEKYGSE